MQADGGCGLLEDQGFPVITPIRLRVIATEGELPHVSEMPLIGIDQGIIRQQGRRRVFERRQRSYYYIATREHYNQPFDHGE
jgi:hypothetical protein